ncbi:MAG TPA: alpha,alpha-trehalase TreF [Arachidicoccus sp.]
MKTLDIFSLDDLLVDVQMQHVFADQKTFVDAVPNFPVKEILEKYHAHKNEDGFDLRRFVAENFTVQKKATADYKTDTSKNISQHIHDLWNVLTRFDTQQSGTLIPLPYPFVVPGGRFGEIYYWDSYFTMLGLKVSGKMDLAEHMANNFTYLIETIGHIPNGNRSYFVTRSQPPFYSHMVRFIAKEKGEIVLIQYLPSLLKEYEYWMQGSKELSAQLTSVKHVVLMPDGSVANRYWDTENIPRPESYALDIATQQKAKDNAALFRNLRAGCESGWDFSSRWFADANNLETICTTDIVPVDLNCLLWHLEITIADAYAVVGNEAERTVFVQKALLRKNVVDKYLWDSDNGIYKDYNHLSQSLTPSIHIAMAYPLFVGIAGELQARSVLDFIEKNMLFPGGLVTTTIETSQQWDAAKGWAPMQWIVYQSALKHGAKLFAGKIKSNWCESVEREFASSGKLLEKYNVTNGSNSEGGGEYPNQDGFGWTNAVYLAMMDEGLL